MTGKVGIVETKKAIAFVGDVISMGIVLFKKRVDIVSELSDLQTDEIVDLVITDARVALTKIMESVKS